MIKVASLYHAQVALHTTQEGLGELLGVSRRTIVRWTATGGYEDFPTLRKLATLVYPNDPELAGMFAARCGHTLETLGIRKPPPPQPPPPPPEPPKKEPMPRAIDVVVCAAAEAIDGTPRTARAALLAGVRAAKEMSLDLDAIEAALAPAPAARPARGAKRRSEAATAK
jgi:hypothetical protein